MRIFVLTSLLLSGIAFIGCKKEQFANKDLQTKESLIVQDY